MNGHDKDLHFIVGTVISMGTTLVTRDPVVGFALGTAAGVLKEARDARGAGECSYNDLAVTMVGAAVGAVGGKLLLRPGYIGYRVEF